MDSAYNLLGINWVMVETIRDEIWAWKKISRVENYTSPSLLSVFWLVSEENNKRGFKDVEANFDRLTDT